MMDVGDNGIQEMGVATDSPFQMKKGGHSKVGFSWTLVSAISYKPPLSWLSSKINGSY
jgi:hypothetical protein